MFQSHGNLYSTVDDLAKFMNALRGTTLLSAASREKMFTSHYKVDEYSYGMEFDPLVKHKADGHGGSFNGAISIARVFLEDDLTVVLLSSRRANSNALV